jgi:hypothetical protein
MVIGLGVDAATHYWADRRTRTGRYGPFRLRRTVPPTATQKPAFNGGRTHGVLTIRTALLRMR